MALVTDCIYTGAADLQQTKSLFFRIFTTTLQSPVCGHAHLTFRPGSVKKKSGVGATSICIIAQVLSVFIVL